MKEEKKERKRMKERKRIKEEKKERRKEWKKKKKEKKKNGKKRKKRRKKKKEERKKERKKKKDLKKPKAVLQLYIQSWEHVIILGPLSIERSAWGKEFQMGWKGKKKNEIWSSAEKEGEKEEELDSK